MKIEILKIENNEGIRWRTMTCDIEKFLTNNEKYRTILQVIGLDMMFRDFIIKDWF